jgi:diadenylate cyclase
VAAAEPDVALLSVIAAVAPGTDLRDGLDRILRGNTGALVVLGFDRVVDALCTGGFALDVEFSATRLRELAKMDGAVVLSTDGTRILRAAVHLMPDAAIVTEESGTRHRTAQRVASQTGYPVISVSQSMKIIGLYVGTRRRYVIEDSAAILDRANQAIATLERYKSRLDEVAGTLSALEIEDLVTLRDATVVSQRLEMVRRIAAEISRFVIELGTDGRLLELQLNELMNGVESSRELLVRDYFVSGRRAKPLEQALGDVDDLTDAELLDLTAVGRALGFVTPEAPDTPISPRGFRLLAQVPRLPGAVIDRLVEHFGGLQKLLAATVDDLQMVEGVGETRARSVRESLSRLADASILERFS